MNKQSGFSLLEVMVVLVIIGMIMSIVAPNIMGQQEEAAIDKAHLDIQQAGQYRFVLEDLEGNAVGCVDLFDYDAVDRRAAIGIIIEKKYRQQGFAREAISLMKDYAFNRIGMHQLYCSVGVLT